MSQAVQYVVVALLLLAAVVYFVRYIARQASKGGSCDGCSHGGGCEGCKLNKPGDSRGQSSQ